MKKLVSNFLNKIKYPALLITVLLISGCSLNLNTRDPESSVPIGGRTGGEEAVLIKDTDEDTVEIAVNSNDDIASTTIDAIHSLAFIYGYDRTSGDWDRLSSTSTSNNEGTLMTFQANDVGLSVAQGKLTGVTFVHKFGNAPDFDAGDGSVHIWDGADDGGSDQMQYTFSSSTDINTISSSDDTDTQVIEVQGLDGEYNLVVQEKTLTGQTPATLDTSLRRVFRVKNMNSTNFAGTIYVTATTTTFSTGVPDNLTKIRAQVANGNNQTLMAIYTIPNGKTGYMSNFWAATAGASRSSNYVIDLFARPFGGVFQLKHRTALADAGTSHFMHPYEVPEKFSAKTDIIMKADMQLGAATAASVSAGFDLILVDN